MSDVNQSRIALLSKESYAHTNASEKIIFADQLRAVAFLCVVIVHWFGIYSLNSTFISSVTGAPAEKVGDPSIYSFLLPPLPHFNYGPFGVAIFFMISGFVIPFTFKNKSKKGFISSRLLRIYPTYIACSLAMLAVSYASHLYWGSQVGISFARFMANIALIAPVFNFQSIDYINWTLSIEIKFYLVCLLIYSSIRAGHVRGIIAIPAVTFLVIYMTRTMNIGGTVEGEFSFNALKVEFIYITFMMLGVAVNLFHRKSIGSTKFMLTSAAILSLFAVSWKFGPQHRQFVNVGINYLYAYVVFIIAFLSRRHFKKIAQLSFLANISYSFYALHSIIGYCIIRVVEHETSNYPISLVTAFIFVMLTAYLMNMSVEKKCISMAKKIR